MPGGPRKYHGGTSERMSNSKWRTELSEDFLELCKGQRATYLWNWNTLVSNHPNEWIVVVCITTSCRKPKKQAPYCLSVSRQEDTHWRLLLWASEWKWAGADFLSEEKYKHLSAQTVPSPIPRKANKGRIPCYSHQILNQEVKEVRKSQGMTHDKNVFLSCVSKIIKNKSVAVIMVLSWTFKDKH